MYIVHESEAVLAFALPNSFIKLNKRHAVEPPSKNCTVVSPIRMAKRSPRNRRRPSRRPSAFENTIDDLTMKRMGRGSIYYGERPVLPDVEEEPEDDELKPDPVLVTGATGQTGQWIALGLMNNEFNVRCLTRHLAKAEAIFGPSGSNLDVFEGSITNPTDVQEAVDGSVAIVCASGSQWWIPGGFSSVDVKGVENLIEAAKKAGNIQRFVLISSAEERSTRGAAKRKAEKTVMESGVPYAILRVAPLSNAEGGVRSVILSSTEISESGSGTLSRVDLAQAVCQCLVYERSVSELQKEDPEMDFDFPNCTIHVENGSDAYIPNKRFWKREFNRISDQQREKENPPLTSV